MKLRDYQERGIRLISETAREFNRVLVQAPTGSGKTEMLFHITQAYHRRSMKVLILVRRRQIVFQTIRRLKDSGFTDCGIFMAGQKLEPEKGVQIASIDTIMSKIKLNKESLFLRNFNAIIVDEAHDSTSETYRKFFSWIEGRDTFDMKTHLKESFNKKYFGFTATPYQVGKKSQTFWERCVVVTTTEELIKQDYLSPVKLFIPLSISTKNIEVDVYSGDYNNKELYNVVSERKIMGKIVEEYKDKGKNKPAVCFAVNKKHSTEIAKAFMDEGIEAVHVEDTTPQKERDRAISRLKENAKRNMPFVLCNVNIFSTGVDIPEASVGIMARPTESKILWYQQVGRLLRKSEGKSHAVIIDHGGNALRFGGVTNYHAPELIGKKFEEPDIKFSVCPSCFYYHPKVTAFCEACGMPIKQVLGRVGCGEERVIESDEDYEMKHMDDVMFMEIMRYINKHVTYRKEVLNLSERECWKPVYKKFGNWFFKYAERVGCSTYVIDGFRKDSLILSAQNERLIIK